MTSEAHSAPGPVATRVVARTGHLCQVIAVLLVLLSAGGVTAAERVALVIGNSNYTFAPALKNPRNDAEALAGALNRLGFRVIKGIDVDRFNMQTLVRAFASEVEGARIALFYYAGHGLQLNGKNYLLPIDAKLEREVDLDFEATDVNFVLRQMERDDRVNIVLLDACRNNPLSDKLARSLGQRSAFLGRGLARVETGVGTLVAYSTQPGNVALDGDGPNSPFAEALLDNIETPGLDIEVLLRRVRERVIAATGGKQVPWSNSSLVGDKVVLMADDEVKEPVVALPPAVGDQEPLTSDSQLEITFWTTVRESRSPAMLRAYLAQYPKGNFVILAHAMLEVLESGNRQTEQPAPTPPAEVPAVQEVTKVPDAPVEPESPQPSPEILPAIPLPRDKPEAGPQPDAPPDADQLPPPQQAVITPPAQKLIETTPPAKKKKVLAPPPPRPVLAPDKKQKKKKQVLQSPPRSEIRTGPEAEQSCGYCYECVSEACRQRRWTCGARYRMRQQQGLCNFFH